MSRERLYLFDTTLRDGAQTNGVDFTLHDKQIIAQMLDDLGIDDDYAKRIGLSLYKVGMTWPLEREGVRHFAEGLEEILVVEEKRQVVEYQLKEQLYNWRDDVRPRVVGKFDEKGEWVRPHGDWLLPSLSELTPAIRPGAASNAKLVVAPGGRKPLPSIAARAESM